MTEIKNEASIAVLESASFLFGFYFEFAICGNLHYDSYMDLSDSPGGGQTCGGAIMAKEIEDYVRENLTEEAQATALEFIGYVRSSDIELYKDNGPYWKDKIYYWLRFKGECIAYIAVKNPDEPQNLWTVWSDDSIAFRDGSIDEETKNSAWQHIDFCCQCGSCGGGKRKAVFGKEFDGVCRCTFRVDNPKESDLPFLKKMLALCKRPLSDR